MYNNFNRGDSLCLGLFSSEVIPRRDRLCLGAEGAHGSLKEKPRFNKALCHPLRGTDALLLLTGFVVSSPLFFFIVGKEKLSIFSTVYEFGANLFLVPLWSCVWVILYNDLKEAQAPSA